MYLDIKIHCANIARNGNACKVVYFLDGRDPAHRGGFLMTLPEDRRFERGVLPVSHFGLNWPDFFAKYPLPDVFSETVYLWDKSRLADLQNDRFKEILDVGWSNSYYRQLWSSAEVRHEHVRSIDDIARLPTFNTDHIKANQDALPPFGSITGVSRADFGKQPMKVQTSGGTTGKPRPTLFGQT